MPPRKAKGSVPTSGNSKVPVPHIRFDEIEETSVQTNAIKANSRPAQHKRGFTSFFFRIFALYAIVAALLTCSSHPFSFNYSTKDSRAICRSLAHGKSHIVPIVTPWIHSAHQRIDPYTGPYVRAVQPYTRAAWKQARPYYKQAQKQGKVAYNRHLEPLRKKAIKKGKAYTDPHVKMLNKKFQKQVQPHIDNLNSAVKPYQDVYKRDVAPYLSQAYTQSIAASGASYAFYVKQVHPHVLKSLQQLHAFYINHADPAMRRAYSLYVRPQVERLLAKVFERKVHATGSEVIAETKQEVKQAEKQGKARSKEQAAEAEREAIRKVEEPSVVERAQQAAESLLGTSKDEADRVETARLDAELDAELEKVKEQLEAWESGMGKLIAEEYKLFTERISDLRNRRLADLPDHFASLTETFVEDEVAAILTRLERVYKKLSKSDLSVNDQLREANKQYDLQKAKLTQSQESLEKQVASYAAQLKADELKSVEASAGEVRRYVREARKSYGRIIEEAKFLRSVEDYEGWDNGMIKRASLFEEDLQEALQDAAPLGGLEAVDLRKEPKLDSHIAELQTRVKKLYTTASSQVYSYVTTGNLKLRGEGSLGAISDATDVVADHAKALAEGAASTMLDAALAARKRVGLGPKETPGILERIQEGLVDATKSAASVVGATPTAKSAGEYVESYVESATSLAASAVGYKTEPDSYTDVISDNVQSAYDAAASTAEVLNESVGKVYDSAVKNVEDAFEAATTSAGNIYKAASSSVTNVLPTANIASEGLEGARSILDVAQEQYASISHSASRVAESAGASGFSIIDQVTSTVGDTGARGVEQGSQSIKQIYETVKDTVESAGEAVTQATEAVVDAVSGENDESNKLVGKKPEDKDFNTVGKTAEVIKEKIIHAEL